jgi:fluoride exporter
MSTFYQAILVFIGGGLGSISRWTIGKWVHEFSNASFPWATLFSNILAVIVLGFASFFFKSDEWFKQQLFRSLIIIGFCGGLSTFSTFSFESIQLLREGKILFFLLNIALSLFTCFVIIYIFTAKAKPNL